MPLEVLTLKLDEDSDKKSIDAHIGTSTVTLQQIDKRVYALLIPESIVAGTYEIGLSNSQKTVSLTITERAAIINPTVYIQDFLKLSTTQFERAKAISDSLVKHTLITVDSATEERKSIQKKIDDATSQFDALPEKDKKICAQFIAANRTLLDSLNQLVTNVGVLTSLKSARVIANCPQNLRDEYVSCVMEKLLLSTSFVLYSIVGIRASLESIGTLLGATGLAVFSVAFLISLDTLNKQLRYYLNSLTVYSGDEPELTLSLTSVGNEIKSGLSRLVKLKLPLRNFQENLDKNSSDVSVKKFIHSVQLLRESFSGLLGDLLSVRFDFAPIRKGFMLPETIEKLSVTILNNTKVNPVIANLKNGLFDLSFTSTEKTDQIFDYKIKYLYGDTAIEKIVTNNKLVGTTNQVDLTDCKIKTTDGIPITTLGETGKEYTFSLEGSCKFPKATLFSWNFGDGTADVVDADINQVKHTYKTAGNHTIKLRVLTQESGTDYIYFQTTAQIKEKVVSPYFTCKIDGISTELKNQSFVDWSNNSKAIFGFSYDGGEQKVGNVSIGLIVAKNKLNGAGTYTFNTTDIYGSVWIVKSIDAVTKTHLDDIYDSHNKGAGSLIVTSMTPDFIEGTFSFTASEEQHLSNPKTVIVTEGKFRVKIR